MSYLSTIDFADDPAFVDRFTRNMKGDLDLSWMKVERERPTCRPLNERRGLTFPAALRAIRVFIIGRDRPGWVSYRHRRMKDYG